MNKKTLIHEYRDLWTKSRDLFSLFASKYETEDAADRQFELQQACLVNMVKADAEDINDIWLKLLTWRDDQGLTAESYIPSANDYGLILSAMRDIENLKLVGDLDQSHESATKKSVA